MIDDAWLARARSFLAKKQSTWANHDVLNAQMVDLLPEALAEIEHLGGEIKELEVLRSDLTEDLRKQEQISDQLRKALVDTWAKGIYSGSIRSPYWKNIEDKQQNFYKKEACRQLAAELPELGPWEEEEGK